MQTLRLARYALLVSLLAIPVSPVSAFEENNTGYFDDLVAADLMTIKYKLQILDSRRKAF